MTANLIRISGRIACATKYGSKEWSHASLLCMKLKYTFDERQGKSK